MLYDIAMLFTRYLHNLYHLQAVKIICSNLSLIYVLKDNNFAENYTKLAENLKKKIGFCRTRRIRFLQLCVFEGYFNSIFKCRSRIYLMLGPTY